MKAQAIAGYSGTPLAKKLGIDEGSHVLLLGAPDEYAKLLGPISNAVVFDKKLSEGTAVVHLFVKRKAELEKHLAALRTRMRSDAVAWVSWPKKSSRVATDITEDIIREVALPMGFVDVKVCAVTDVWSGLKLVIRKTLR